ncbi:MAG: patatin-like phospholipase family protein [gamma proteobacterium symbiont of Taylorina sp.]|nr:patatin-like phospholipase family protein [gamma proteobacterium symbiont of Taylorina sp.]
MTYQKVLYRIITSTLFLSLVSGCANYSRVTNVEIEADHNGDFYTQSQYFKKNEDLKIFMSFSGGGTRAAAFSYGVLETLRDIKIPLNEKEISLLSEVDVISSVSGGSFTSAYYGLYGDKIFEDYEHIFLKTDVQGILVRGIFNPLNWFRFVGSSFDRSELAIDYYDKYIFKGATFADFRKDMPFIQINATDLSSGHPFIFKQEYFDLICSDLSRFKVARAVAASSAVPVAFAPITVKNYKECKDISIPKIWTDIKFVDSVRTREMKEALGRYSDKEKVQYVHLVDGGIADNLGLRVLYDSVNVSGGVTTLAKKTASAPPKYLVIILINAAVSPEKNMDRTDEEPPISEQIDAFSSAQINRYSIESIQLLKESLQLWATQLSETVDYEVKPYFIQIDFDGIQEKSKNKLLNTVSTSFVLPPEQVDGLRKAAHYLLNESQEFQSLLRDLRAK